MRSGTHIGDRYRYLELVPFVGIAMLLVAACRLYSYAYFWLDDFNNLHFVRLRTFPEAIGLMLSPSAEHFRPVGMFFYQVAYALFDRDPRPYHWMMWAIHALNIGLVYLILKRFSQSRAGAAVGALLFVYPAAFTDVFWSFGTIFELTGAALFFTGILLWQRMNRTLAVILSATAVFILAIKAKEMAITLPAVWLLQDLLVRRPMKWKETLVVVLPGIAGAWFGVQRLLAMQETSPGQPYFMDLQAITMGHGFSYYFNALFGTQLRWQVWCIGFVAAFLLIAGLRLREMVFFQSYVFVTFLPVIFLINHRDPFYAYFPMLGVCGMAAMLVKGVTEWLALRVSQGRLAIYGSVVFAVLCVVLYGRARDATEARRQWQDGIARNFRDFVKGVETLSPDPGETLYFKSMPEHFDRGTLDFAVEFALGREDVDAQWVERFPPEARHRLIFKNGIIIRVAEWE